MSTKRKCDFHPSPTCTVGKVLVQVYTLKYSLYYAEVLYPPLIMCTPVKIMEEPCKYIILSHSGLLEKWGCFVSVMVCAYIHFTF